MMNPLFATITLSLGFALAPVFAQKAEAIYQRGVNHEKSGDFKAAEQAYRAALQIDPAHAPALNDLGVLLEDRADIAGAAELFAKALAAAPGDPVAAFNRQRILKSPEGMKLMAEGKVIRRLEFRDQLGNLLPDGGRRERPVPGANDTFAWARIGAASFKQGDRFEVDKANEIVVRWLALSWVDDAEWIVEPTADGVNIAMQLTLAPKLGKIGFIGNRLVPSATLEAALGLKPGDRISWAVITRAELAVEAVYQRVMVMSCLLAAEFVSRGGLATSDPRVLIWQWQHTIAQLRMGVIGALDVKSLPPAYQEFLGSRFILDFEGMKLEQTGVGTCDVLIHLTDPWLLDQKPMVEVRNADEMIASDTEPYQVLGKEGELLEGCGMFDAKLQETQTTDSHLFGARTVVTLDPGLCHTIRRVDFAVTKAWVWEAAKKPLSLQPIRRFNDRPLTAAVVRQIDEMLDEVRLKGGVDPHPEVRAAGSGVADLVISIDPPTGIRNETAIPRIDQVNIQGNINTPDRIVRRALPARLLPGARFDQREADKITPCLQELGFGSILVGTMKNEDHSNLHDVSISIEEGNDSSQKDTP